MWTLWSLWSLWSPPSSRSLLRRAVERKGGYSRLCQTPPIKQDINNKQLLRFFHFVSDADCSCLQIEVHFLFTSHLLVASTVLTRRLFKMSISFPGAFSRRRHFIAKQISINTCNMGDVQKKAWWCYWYREGCTHWSWLNIQQEYSIWLRSAYIYKYSNCKWYPPNLFPAFNFKSTFSYWNSLICQCSITWLTSLLYNIFPVSLYAKGLYLLELHLFEVSSTKLACDVGIRRLMSVKLCVRQFSQGIVILLSNGLRKSCQRVRQRPIDDNHLRDETVGEANGGGGGSWNLPNAQLHEG